jgi:hypothetical protein
MSFARSASPRSVLPKLVLISIALAAFSAVFFLGRLSGFAAADAAKKNQVYEIRTYTTEDGKLDALLARFRDHTTALFEKHGMKNIGYWVPQDEPKSKNTLIYIIAHESRDAAKKNWAEFSADEDWKKARTDSEAAGKIVNHVDSVYADPTDFSPLK